MNTPCVSDTCADRPIPITYAFSYLSAMLVMLFIIPFVLLAPDKPVPDRGKQRNSNNSRVNSHVSDGISTRNLSAKTGAGHGDDIGFPNNSNNNSKVDMNNDYSEYND